MVGVNHDTLNTSIEAEACFAEDLRTQGPVLKQVKYSTDEDCVDLCFTVHG